MSLLLFRSQDRQHTTSDIPASEEYALRWLYNHCGGPAWTNNTNWLTSTTAGNWFGITVAGGHVTVIDLNTNNLVGSMTGWNIGAFTELMYLWLYTNALLSGNLNVESLSTTIQSIKIYTTTTTLSGSVAGLTALTVLFVQGSNTLSGSVAGLTALTVLDVEGSNTLSGSVAGLTALTYLVVQGSNTLSGSVAGLTALTVLYVQGSNTLSGSVAGLTALTVLSVQGSNTITWDVGTLIQLNTLNCADNALAQAAVDAIVAALYTARANYVKATLTCTLGGTNQTPSGLYQDTTPPVTGKEKIYKLVVDPQSDHTTNFVVTYTA